MYKPKNDYIITKYESRFSFLSIKDYQEYLPVDLRYTQYLDKSSCDIESFMAFFPDVWCPYYGGYALVSRSQWNDRNYISISDNDDFSASKDFPNRESCKRFFDEIKLSCPITMFLVKKLWNFDL